MRANNAHSNLSDDRQREHQRQQERLKAMAASSDKAQMVSADVMIENLLKDSFKKLPQMPSPVNQAANPYSELPLWLQCDSAAVPAQYNYFWSLVHSTVDIADTQKVSQLLLTSGLHVDLLGFIWNIANKAIPGQLTKQEFYIVLALVGLAQTGYTFNNLNILKLITVPSIPVLQVGLQNYPVPHPQVLQSSGSSGRINSFREPESSSSLHSKPNLNDFEKDKNSHVNIVVSESSFLNDFEKDLVSQKENNPTNLLPNVSSSSSSRNSEIHLIDQTRGLHKNSNFPCIGSSPTAELEDDFSAFQSVPIENQEDQTELTAVGSADDFTEFQSAKVENIDPFETIVINQKREIPRIPLPKTFTGKFTNLKSNILKISPETEKKLKVLSPTESLSSLPESKISSSNKVSTSISVLGSNQGIGSRLANHSFSTKLDRPKCHKHHKIKINPISPVHQSAGDEILLGVKPRNLECVIPKCRPKNSTSGKTFLLKETKISSSEGSDTLDQPQSEQHESIEPPILPSGENTRQIEIPMLGTFNETTLPTQSKLQTSSIDLISVQEDKYSALREIEMEVKKENNYDSKEVCDDFGDFLSADIPAPPASESSSTLLLDSNPDPVVVKNEEKLDWGDWNFNTEPSLSSTDISGLENIQKDTGIVNEPSVVKPENDFFDSFASLTLNENCDINIAPTDASVPSQQDIFRLDTKVITEVNDVLIGVKPNEASPQSKEYQNFNTQPDNEFWEFLSNDIKSGVEENFSRHGSLPSLDLKISPTDESEQDFIWRKCLDSCHGLIQEGYEIFNKISAKSVLDEVFASPKTEEYLNYLNIVFQISKRVSENLKIIPSSQEEVEKLWRRLQDLCFEYNIKLKHDEDNCYEGKVRCSICLRRIGFDIINQGSSSYHPTCANLWINCVEESLPVSV